MSREALLAHLARGDATTCRAWAVTRADGRVLGFTDHDRDLVFDGITFAAESGVSAAALQQATGLAVDNSEAAGALSAAALTEADIAAGRWDGAEVRAWLVNWQAVAERLELFRGRLGEILREGIAFRAELRGLSAPLNQPQGRVYLPACSAVLGDARCGVDLSAPGYGIETEVLAVEGEAGLVVAPLADFAPRWFEKGRLAVLSGAAAGLGGTVKSDRLAAAGRRLVLWQGLRAALAPGDVVRLQAGCDHQPGTCRLKFDNLRNFRGFPHVPGEDWLTAVPARSLGEG